MQIKEMRAANFIHLSNVGLFFLLAINIGAQSSPMTTPVGVWRGTSKCLVRPSACKDEITVYRFTPMKAADSVSLDAFKILGGEEQDMGVLACGVTSKGLRVQCAMARGIWLFTIRGDSLIGEMRQPDNTKFREVRAIRSR